MAPSFAALILMLPGTPLVATAQRRLAVSIAPPLCLSVLECPLQIATLDENLLWHERSAGDPQMLYLREMLQNAAADLDADLEPGHKRRL